MIWIDEIKYAWRQQFPNAAEKQRVAEENALEIRGYGEYVRNGHRDAPYVDVERTTGTQQTEATSVRNIAPERNMELSDPGIEVEREGQPEQGYGM